MNVIECQNLVKNYGRKQVLEDLSFNVTENKITGLIGRNGVGKTTLLKIIAGFIRETDGEIKVFSQKPFNSLFVSANSVMIDDHMTFPPSFNLADILKEAEQFYENFNIELARDLLNYFSLSNHLNHDKLSKGMKSTFNMILGLSSRCALTIYDEPTTGMDAAVRKDFYRALLKDYLAHPRSILLSSHHLQEIEDLLEDVLLIHEGKVKLHLSISDFKEWAIGLQGKKSAVSRWTDGQQVIYEKEIGPGLLYTVIRNEGIEGMLHEARQEGIDVIPVSANDLCIYLTDRQKGGIDDVFNRNHSL
ncbi:ABC transporter ATP-binding protein [Lederbergia sp. NSJ-179]|uniref:ATP-binding cassette domain-containing protein n=1 Tax=Lederbergia sp. NSJ-179 TaxID=2931402 RepID=UPI001FD475FB|nr:ABC transporter ATP-binding protein [Lederbergia sp. NSJ-179]MCJ7842563.1 ABC transporter ATP-binding protein [Lederbergia sp. NSJ-179]